MTEPRPEEDVQIPLRVQAVVARQEGWRGRSVNLVAVGLVAFVAVGIVLGTVNVGGPQRLPPLVLSTQEPTASPRAAATSRPSIGPIRTPPPLPEHLVLGDELPTERHLVFANGIQAMDMATGSLGRALVSQDGVVTSLGNAVACACFLRGGGSFGGVRGLELQVAGFDGEVPRTTELVTWDDVAGVPDMTEGASMQLAAAPDRKRIYVLAVARRPPSWTVDLLTVDLTRGDVLDTLRIADLPVGGQPEPTPTPSAGSVRPGEPPDGLYAWAQGLAVTPDGSTAFVSVNYAEVAQGNWSSSNREWMVALDEAVEPTPLAEDVLLPRDGWCYGRPVFVDDIATVICTPPAGETPGSGFQVRRIGTDGQSAGSIDLGNELANYYPTPVVDPESKAAYIWNPGTHTMTRIDLDAGTIERATVPDELLDGKALPQNGSFLGAEPSVAISPDRTRLYAIGVRSGESEVGSSSGIWVFDASTLEVLDNWRAPAFFLSVGVSTDGKFVYASGAPNYTPSGRQSRWPASMTVFDADDGQVEVIHGQLGEVWLTLPQL
jgi:hypothetical protein